MTGRSEALNIADIIYAVLVTTLYFLFQFVTLFYADLAIFTTVELLTPLDGANFINDRGVFDPP